MRYSSLEPLEARIAPATISISPLVVDEGDEGTANNIAHIKVTLNAAEASAVTVNYTLMNGSATSGVQFSPLTGQTTTGTITFPGGSVSANIDVMINGNSAVGNDSDFSVQLSSPSTGSNISVSTAKVTIWDDDRTVSFAAGSLNQSITEGNSGTKNLAYSVLLSAPAQHDITVAYGTADGSSYGGAISSGAAADYTPATGTLTFLAGTTTPAAQSFTVGIKGDTLPGPNDNFSVVLSKPTANTGAFGTKLGTSATTATILNDDGSDTANPITVSLVGDITTSEGGTALFGVKLSRLSESPVIVGYHTIDGTATAAADYLGQATGSKTIVSALQDTIGINIRPSDALVEGAETFKLALDGASVNGISQPLGTPNNATATIVADPLPKLKVSDVTVLENAGGTGQTMAQFSISLGFDDNHHFITSQAGSFHYTTANGTAMGTVNGTDGDFKITAGDFSIPAGRQETDAPFIVRVPITQDAFVESNETFTLKLSQNIGAIFGDDTGTGTIVDTNIQVTVGSINVLEGDTGTSSAIFALALGKPVPAGYRIEVDYQTVNDTGSGAALSAANGSALQDYIPVTGKVDFAAGSTVGTAAVTLVGDQVLEGNETFKLQVTAARLILVSSSATADVTLAGTRLTGTGTILNDDGPSVTASITATAATLDEGAANSAVTAAFPVHLSSAYSSDVKVAYTVTKRNADGTTTTQAYTNDSTTLPALVIPAYTQDKTINVSFTHADTVGRDQILTVNITGVTPVTPLAGATFAPSTSAKTATTTVLEDDAFVKIAGASRAEGASGTSLMPFAVQLVDLNQNLVKLDHAVSIPFATADGTAISTGPTADYAARSGTLTFRPGENAATIAVPINGDTLGGASEFFSVKLNSATGAKLYKQSSGTTQDLSVAVGSIINDDAGPSALTLVQTTIGQEPTAGNAAGVPAVFTYQLSAASDSAVSFTYNTTLLTTPAPGTTLASNTDFTAANGIITIPSGTVSGTISVVILDDAANEVANEGAESFALSLTNISGASNAAGSTLTAAGTIAPSDQPTLTVGNVSTVEGASGTHTVAFTISLSAATAKDVTFNVQTAPAGTATAGIDYVALTSTLVTIPAGATQATQNVTINGDNTAGEGDETFIFRVSNVVNAQPGSVDAVGTILSDEAVFTIAPTVTAFENGEIAAFKVTRTGDLGLPADVSFKTIDGTAKTVGALADYFGGTGTIHFEAGATEATIGIALVDDDRHEGDETFSVQLTGATNGVLGAAASLTSTATITDNDAIPTVTILSPAAILEKDSGSTNATFTLTLDHANDESAVVFKVSTMDGTAKAGQDFTLLTNQTVTIPAGALSATFSVAVLNDLTYDSAKTETFKANVVLDPANTGAAKAKFAGTATSISGTGSIIDNEVAPQISVSAATFTEGGASNFIAQLNHPSDAAVTVKYYTVDGTAKSVGTARDFNGKTSAVPGVLTFAAGATTATIDGITSVDDTIAEGNETFKLQLAAPVGATLSKTAGSAIGTIADNDFAYLTINDVSISEGNSGTQNAVFTVFLQGVTASPVTVKYATTSGTASSTVATPGSDYTATFGTLTLGGPNGASSAQISVKVFGDLVNEETEKFSVVLSDATVATILRGTGAGTILDDGDTQGTISVSDATVVEGDGTTDTALQYVVTLSDNAPAGGVSFTVKASELAKLTNVARLGSDFLQPKSTTVPADDLSITIPEGSKTATFSVAVKADNIFEPTEFLSVTLTNITGAQPGKIVGTGTIYDNDLFLSGTVAKWTDVDGDLVTLAVNKGNLGNVGFGFSNTNAGSVGGRILQQLNFVSPQAGNSFENANINIYSTQQPDAAGVLTGNGRVNVGYIRANTSDTAPSLLEVTGVDLGLVTVRGDLSRINAGDLFADVSVSVLDVYSLGVNTATTDPSAAGTTAAPAAALSQLIAGATTIKVANDVSGIIEALGGTSGRIGTLNIGGALRGTAAPDSARILTTGIITRAIIHDIIGGAGAHSGSLTQFDSTASIGTLTIAGNIMAGTGSQSGHVLFPSIGSVSIGGSMHGGFISAANSLGTVTIDGDFDTGAKIYGGGLTNNHAIRSVVVHGKVNNGQILGGYVANVNDTAANQVIKANADAQIDSVQVDGTVLKFDILAGVDPSSTTTGFNRDDSTLFSRIAKVIIDGDVLANSENHYISAQSFGTVTVEGVPKTATLAGTDLATDSKFLLKFSL